MKARKLAKKFNDGLDFNRCDHIPRIKFLNVRFYSFKDKKKNIDVSFLCEKPLNYKRFKKWTDNKGGVHN